MKEANPTIFLGIDLDTWEKIMSVIGFVITVVTLIVAENARQAVRKIQANITFDKRIPQHLKEIDAMLKIFNRLLNDQVRNTDEINSLLGSLTSELVSLKAKMSDERIRSLIAEAERQIKTIHSLSYSSLHRRDLIIRVKDYFTRQRPVVSELIIVSYIQIGEIYAAVENLHKDSKTNIRRV